MKLLKRQDIMRKVVLATLPCLFGAVYYFGWRCLAVVAVACATALVCEYLFCRGRKEPVTEAVFVTGILFALILPPTVPWHVVIIGAAFAIVFSKEVFGGFGRNIFNPAMAGRCFIYICFPLALTASWALPAEGLWRSPSAEYKKPDAAPAYTAGRLDSSSAWGALGTWSSAPGPDALTSATPMGLIKTGKPVPPLTTLLCGNITGVMGATSALLILLGGLYLFITKTANRTIILAVILTYLALNALLTWLVGPPFVGALPPTLGAGFLFGAFFMATDPVSAPKTGLGRVLYGMLIAIFTLVIRNYSIFPAGFMFALLLANMFAPIIDYGVTELKKKRAPANPGTTA
ncbi:MAG: RnfABCDGE type electron transport complex subunit D [bacterium]|nr:RnfABCDGE type electron transport complex subunit D [bacterium]